MLPKKIEQSLNSFERAIKLGLQNKGKYGKYTFVGDLYDWMKFIEIVRNEKIEKAYGFAWNMDTDARDKIPSIIWDYMNKE